jgi:23S rRNA (cytidine1920-2'-O)/16S rRNA (cytidine1409-2'-O)-methyltransferase
MGRQSSKERLDILVVERGLTESRAQAQRLIRAGLVRVAGQVSDKPGVRVMVDSDITLKARPRFVSRGGEKLKAALERFDLGVAGVVAADVGASTGGFTDCLLQHGASRVYAIDVGYGQLAWRLRNDPRVIVMERTNARYLDCLPEAVSLITVDVSFISLGLILPTAVRWLEPGGQVVTLIKPQFEAGRREVGKGGVVRDPAVHRRVLEQVLEIAIGLDLELHGLMPSPLRGPAGNVEFLGWWELQEEARNRSGFDIAIAACMAEEGGTEHG